jgi:magnesium transporter
MKLKNNTQKELITITQHPDYTTEIIKILHSNLLPKGKQEHISAYHEKDIASTLELLNAEERSKFYPIFQPKNLADILEHSENPVLFLNELGMRKKIDVLQQMETTAAVDCLRQMEKADRSALMELMDDTTRREITLLVSFDEDEIGSKMTTNYIAVHADSDIRQAMHSLIEQAAEHDNISTIYVIDNDNTLAGAIELKNLIIARENTKLDTITMTSYPYVYANELIADCINRIVDYSEDAIPVLDADNKLCGVLTSQDIMRLVDDEMGEDYAKLAGLSAEEDLNEPLKKSLQKRLPWLVVLLGLGLLVSSVVGIFEGVAAQLPFIIAFQSLVLDMAGNSGTQSLAVTIRVLMDEKLSGKQKLSLIVKEGKVGLINGFILGILTFLFIGLYLLAAKGQPAVSAFAVSFCTGAALLSAMFLSGLSGTMIPLMFKKLHIDPAVASGPLITTVNDLLAVTAYYGLAWLLLINVLHL